MLLQKQKILNKEKKTKATIEKRQGQLSSCLKCERYVPSIELIINGYRYIEKHCPFDKTSFRVMLDKKNGFDKEEKNPLYKLNIKLGEKLKLKNIKKTKQYKIVLLRTTSNCNSKCEMCYDYYYKPRADIKVEEIEATLKPFKKARVYISGMEATTIKHLPDIIREVKRLGHIAILNTNGLKLSSEQYLKKLLNAGLDRVYMTFDGFDSDICQRIRGGRHEYRFKLKALENLEKLKVPTSILATIVKGVNDEHVKELLNYCKEKEHIVLLSLRALYLPFETKNLKKEMVMSQDEIWRSLEKASDNKINKKTKLQNEKVLSRIFKKLRVVEPERSNFFYDRKTGENIIPQAEIGKLLNKKGIRFYLDRHLLKHALRFTLSGFNLTKFEHNLMKNRLLRINVGGIRTPIDTTNNAKLDTLSTDNQGQITAGYG